MKVYIENVCNIKKANILINENEVNIKYGNNGTGKTSLSKAIEAYIENEDLSVLKSYGSKENEPLVTIDKSFSNCLCFDGNYVNNYLFVDNDLLNDTYDLIIKTEDFENRLEAINVLLNKVKSLCNMPEIMKLKKDIACFDEIKYNSDGSFSNSSKFGKGFKNGVTINQDIPENLSDYKELLQSKINYEWISWLKQGQKYIINEKCPFCTTNISKEQCTRINEVSSFSSSQIMKDNLHSKEIVSTISKYSDMTLSEEVDKINALKGCPTKEDAKLIKSAVDILKTEIQKINDILILDAVSLKKLISGDSLVNMLNSKIINTDIFNVNNLPLQSELINLNKELETLINGIETLKNHLIELNKEMSKNIKNTILYINDFLKISGIPYKVDVEVENSTAYRTYLKPESMDDPLQNPESKLSFGEKNAISLMLFAVEVKSKNPDLIILDDPISSFDTNKKFALMHYLFAEKNAIFKKKTVLILTHDITPVIDFIKLDSYHGIPSNASMLLNKEGIIVEKEITEKDIDNTLQIELSMAENKSLSNISRTTHLRRYYEMSNLFGDEYNMLSSLLHCKDYPDKKTNQGSFIPFTKTEVTDTEISISKHIENFHYSDLLKSFRDNNFLKEEYKKATNFERLNITRVYINNNTTNPNNDICWKFICDTYHIENTMLFGVNDREYDNIPEYIVKICDHIINV